MRTLSMILAIFAIPALALGGLLLDNPTADAAKGKTPARISSVSSVEGPGVGEITIRWKSSGANTTKFTVKTGLSVFSRGGSGRNSKTFSTGGSARSIILSAAQVRAAGAGVGTGNHLYYRVYASNGSKTRWFPNLRATMPEAAKATGNSKVRVASFNIRTARGKDRRSWLRRSGDVAREIKNANAGVVAVQELGPGRADGKKGTLKGKQRQTESLEKALSKIGAGRYQLTRTTPYVKPGTKSDTQGARILYDTKKFKMVSRCSEKTGSRSYSSSCSIKLPLNAGDGETWRRRAAYALLQDKRTGDRFYFVSAHLDARGSGNLRKDKKFDRLRGHQAQAIDKAIKKINKHNYPVIIGGDLNSWQTDRAGNSSHDKLVAAGYYDTAHARVRVNMKYSTISHFEKVQKASAQGYASRLDMILVKHARGADKFAIVTKRVDGTRPSDHNLVLADLRF